MLSLCFGGVGDVVLALLGGIFVGIVFAVSCCAAAACAQQAGCVSVAWAVGEVWECFSWLCWVPVAGDLVCEVV